MCCEEGCAIAKVALPRVGGYGEFASSTEPKSGEGGIDDGGVSHTCKLCECDDDDCVPVPDDEAVDETELLRPMSTAALALSRARSAAGGTGPADGPCPIVGVLGRTTMVGSGVDGTLTPLVPTLPSTEECEATRLSCAPSPSSRSWSRARRPQLPLAERGGAAERFKLPARARPSASAVLISGSAGRVLDPLVPPAPDKPPPPDAWCALRIALAHLPRSRSGVVRLARPSAGASVR